MHPGRRPLAIAREPESENDRPTIAPPPSSQEPTSDVFRRPTPASGDRATLPDGVLDDLAKHFRAGDFEGALVAAEKLTTLDPRNEHAAALAASSRLRLRLQLASRLGSVLSIPRVVVPLDSVRNLPLDHRAGFLLSCVDGRATIEEILDVAGMQDVDALRILLDLFERRVIAIG